MMMMMMMMMMSESRKLLGWRWKSVSEYLMGRCSSLHELFVIVKTLMGKRSSWSFANFQQKPAPPRILENGEKKTFTDSSTRLSSPESAKNRLTASLWVRPPWVKRIFRMSKLLWVQSDFNFTLYRPKIGTHLAHWLRPPIIWSWKGKGKGKGREREWVRTFGSLKSYFFSCMMYLMGRRSSLHELEKAVKFLMGKQWTWRLHFFRQKPRPPRILENGEKKAFTYPPLV